MYKGGPKLLPVALVVVVMIVAIFALVSVGKALLGGSTKTEVVDEDRIAQKLLVSEVDRSVRMTVRGPIVADESFNSYQIEISPVGRRLTTYRGYQNEVINTVQLGNSTAGYEEFIHALDRAGFAEERELPGGLSDVRGLCATGRLFTFEILQAQSALEELWTTSCRESAGSFKGDAVRVRDLFQSQVPDSGARLRGLNL